MQGLELTYETLAATRNEAAVDVLIAALDDPNAANRRRALGALLKRKEPRSSEQVLANWGKLNADDLRVLRPKKSWLNDAIGQALRGQGENVLTAITAAESLQMASVIPQLTLLAESSASRDIQQRASEAVIAIVQPLGRAARADRDRPTVRGPVLARLADSVRRFSMHRNEQLVDAFLLVSTWGDGELRQMTSEDGPQMELICKRLMFTAFPGVIDLLSGFVRRRSIPERIGGIIQARTDEPFREALLRKITSEPTATVLNNIRDIGIPKCCLGGEQILDDIAPDYRAAMIHLYVAGNHDVIETLHLIAAAVEAGGGCENAAAMGLSRCEVPDVDLWMRAAICVADGDAVAIAADDNARLLQRLIDLLCYPDAALCRGVRRVLGPLHADQMLHRFESLRPRSRRRLGRVVMMVDPDAVERVRDALRHPVLQNRLEAISMADALAVVDLLSDAFTHIAHQDHLQARVRAAEVMSDATGDATLWLLREMTELPECPVRDAALASLEHRQTTKTR